MTKNNSHKKYNTQRLNTQILTDISNYKDKDGCHRERDKDKERDNKDR